MRLPGGKFTTTHKTIQTQFGKYVEAVCGKASPLALHLSITVKGGNIIATVSSSSDGELLRMKPLIEALNSAREGLGWWAYETASSAKQDRYQIYRPQDLYDFLEGTNCFTKFSDQGVIDEYNEMNGESLTTREEVEAEYQFFWPSDLINSVDGHTWLLDAHEYDEDSRKSVPVGIKPRIASLADAEQFVGDSTSPSELKDAVADLIALHHELHRTDTRLKNATPADCNECDDYEPEIYGAACILVWDEAGFALELIQHNEVHLMEGESTDSWFEFICETSQAGIEELVQSIKDLVRRHAAISKAFQHFEVIQ